MDTPSLDLRSKGRRKQLVGGRFEFGSFKNNSYRVKMLENVRYSEGNRGRGIKNKKNEEERDESRKHH